MILSVLRTVNCVPVFAVRREFIRDLIEDPTEQEQAILACVSDINAFLSVHQSGNAGTVECSAGPSVPATTVTELTRIGTTHPTASTPNSVLETIFADGHRPGRKIGRGTCMTGKIGSEDRKFLR